MGKGRLAYTSADHLWGRGPALSLHSIRETQLFSVGFGLLVFTTITRNLLTVYSRRRGGEEMKNQHKSINM